MTARPRPTAELTETVQRILAHSYPGQIPAVVIECAVRQMAARDQRKTRAADR